MPKINPTQESQTQSVATSSTGANFVELPNNVADEVTIIVLAAGVGLDIMIGHGAGSNDFIQVDAPSGLTLPLCGNTAEVRVRRTDQSNTPATVRFFWRRTSA